MSFVDARNSRGEIQRVPEHFLTEFPDQFEAVDSEGASPDSQAPTETTSTSAKAAKVKES